MKTEKNYLKSATLQSKNEDLSNLDVIEQHLISGGETLLTPKQQELLTRWVFADELMRENVGRLKREAIANKIKVRFGIERAAAYQDIANAEKVFSTSAPLNKRYRIQLRIEFIENQIRLAAADNDHKAVKGYEDTLREYYKIYPDIQDKESPKVLMFSFDVDKLNPRLLPQDETDSILNAQLQKNKELQRSFADIDFEEVDLEEDDYAN